jgi:hypothetical protein
MLKPEINTAAARFRYLEWLVLAEWKDNDDASMILDPNEDAILVTDDKHSRPFYLIGNLPLLEWIAVSYIKMNSVDLPELKLILNVALWTQVTNKLLSHGEGMSVHSDTITPCATIESPEVPPVREIRETAFSNLMTHIMGFHRSLYEPTRPRGVIDVNLAEQNSVSSILLLSRPPMMTTTATLTSWSPPPGTLLQLLSRRTWLDNLEPLPTVEKYRSGLYAYISCSSGPLVYMYPGPASEDSSSLTKSDVGVKDDELGGVELKCEPSQKQCGKNITLYEACSVPRNLKASKAYATKGDKNLSECVGKALRGEEQPKFGAGSHWVSPARPTTRTISLASPTPSESLSSLLLQIHDGSNSPP